MCSAYIDNYILLIQSTNISVSKWIITIIPHTKAIMSYRVTHCLKGAHSNKEGIHDLGHTMTLSPTGTMDKNAMNTLLDYKEFLSIVPVGLIVDVHKHK